MDRYFLEKSGMIRRIESVDVVFSKEAHQIADQIGGRRFGAGGGLHGHERLQQRHGVTGERSHAGQVAERVEDLVARKVGRELAQHRPCRLVDR